MHSMVLGNDLKMPDFPRPRPKPRDDATRRCMLRMRWEGRAFMHEDRHTWKTLRESFIIL